MIPVVNNEFYPRWFLLDLLCLHSSVLCKNPVTSLYLAGVSPNFLIVFCIKSLMLDLTLHSDPTQPLLCASVCQFIRRFAHPRLETRSTQTKGPRGSAAVLTDRGDRAQEGKRAAKERLHSAHQPLDTRLPSGQWSACKNQGIQSTPSSLYVDSMV